MAPGDHRTFEEMPRLTRADLELPPAVRACLPPCGIPIMKLSRELHLRIAEDLEFPENMCLKFTSRYFYQLVKPMDLGQLWEAELSDLCFRNRVMACSGCVRLRKPLEFLDDVRIPNCMVISNRTCIDCAVNGTQHSLKIGDMVAWDGYRHVMCRNCKEFKTSSPRKALGLCQKCWNLSDVTATDGRSNRQPWEREFNSMQLKATGSMRFHHGLVCRACYRDLDKCPSVDAVLSRIDRADLCRLCLVKTFGCCAHNRSTGTHSSRTAIYS